VGPIGAVNAVAESLLWSNDLMHGYDWEVPGGHIASLIPISVGSFGRHSNITNCGRGKTVVEDGL